MSVQRVTIQQIEGKILSETYLPRVAGTTLTICVLLLENGMTVTGESACVDPAAYDETLGREYSREQAVAKVWALEGYLLRERIARGELAP